MTNRSRRSEGVSYRAEGIQKGWKNRCGNAGDQRPEDGSRFQINASFARLRAGHAVSRPRSGFIGRGAGESSNRRTRAGCEVSGFRQRSISRRPAPGVVVGQVTWTSAVPGASGRTGPQPAGQGTWWLPNEGVHRHVRQASHGSPGPAHCAGLLRSPALGQRAGSCGRRARGRVLVGKNRCGSGPIASRTPAIGRCCNRRCRDARIMGARQLDAKVHGESAAMAGVMAIFTRSLAGAPPPVSGS